jgi:hypothetical protein
MEISFPPEFYVALGNFSASYPDLSEYFTDTYLGTCYNNELRLGYFGESTPCVAPNEYALTFSIHALKNAYEEGTRFDMKLFTDQGNEYWASELSMVVRAYLMSYMADEAFAWGEDPDPETLAADEDDGPEGGYQ